MSATPIGAAEPILLTAEPTRRYFWIGFVLILLALWFVKLPHRVLADPDEGRYAEISREMVATGDWVTPRLNGFAYLQKPPLQYWATAAAYEVLGTTEWTARLWTAVTGLLAVLATWFAGRRLLGKAAGEFGALALLASPYFVVMSGINTLDMGVSLFLSGAVFAYLLSRQATTRAAEAGWMLVAWAAMALAVMSKGLIGVVLPFATLVGYAVWHRQPGVLRRLYWLVNRPKPYLMAFILALVVSGIYAMEASLFDVGLVLGAGVLGYALRYFGVPQLPLVLGVVLGFMVESNYRRALVLSSGDHSIFVQDPISLGLLVAAAAIAVFSLRREVGRARKEGAASP